MVVEPVPDDLLAAAGAELDLGLDGRLGGLVPTALPKSTVTGMPTPTVEPFAGERCPMKSLAGETVLIVAFAVAERPLASSASAAIWYLVARFSGPSGFQDVPSADSVPRTSAPVARAVMVTLLSLPSLTVTETGSLIPTPCEPCGGVIVIRASDTSWAAALSAWGAGS